MPSLESHSMPGKGLYRDRNICYYTTLERNDCCVWLDILSFGLPIVS